MSGPGPDGVAGRVVLVTGASGFIGGHLVRALAARGARLELIGRSRERLEEVGRPVGAGVRIADLRSLAGTRRALRGVEPDLVFHLAAYTDVGRELRHARPSFAHNLLATVNLVHALEHRPPQRFVCAGTSEEYGSLEPPFREDMGPCPVSHYGSSKAASTLWLRALHASTGFPVVIPRIFLAYGPGERSGRLVPSAIAAALRGRDFPMTPGGQTRELTFVADLVEGLILAATVPGAVGEVINLSTGREHSVREVVERIFHLAGSTGRPLPGAVPYRKAEIWRNAADVEKAARILGWRATTGLDEGLRRTIEHVASTMVRT